MPLERYSAAWFGLNDIAVFRGDRVDTKVPDAKIHGFVRDNLHKGELSEIERLFRRDLQPMTAWQQFRGSFDDILLTLAGAEQRDADAIDDAGTSADISSDDEISAVRRATAGVVLHTACGAVGVDRKGRTGGVADAFIADTQIKDWVFDMELDR
jgi:hypothetical protein